MNNKHKTLKQSGDIIYELSYDLKKNTIILY